MIEIVQDKLIPHDTNNEDVATVIELSDEDTDLVGGGPEVIDDPTPK